MKFSSFLLTASALAASSDKYRTGITVSANDGKPFYGITYNPNRSSQACQVPGDPTTFSGVNIAEDLEVLSKYTNSVRTYALGCDYDKTILKEAAKRGMDVTFGLWVDKWNTFQYQFDLLKKMIQQSSTEELKAIRSLVVGNEAIFRGEQTSQEMADKINLVREYLKEVGLENVTLTTAEIDRDYDEILIDAVDYLLPNLHIFFDGYDVPSAPGWYFYKYQKLTKLTDKPIIVGEVGWPSGGNPWDSSGKPSPSVPGVENSQFIMNSLLCEANRLGLPYFYFDAFDARWKTLKDESEDSEYYWGVGTVDRKVKDYIKDGIKCSAESYQFKKIPVCNDLAFDASIYTCTNNLFLCPKPLIGCGESLEKFSCIDPEKYTCTNNLYLCPAPLVGCGSAPDKFSCYDQTQYSCSEDGKIGPK